MSVDVNNLKVAFSKMRYDNLIHDWYMVKTSPTKKENDVIDKFLLITLLEGSGECCLEDIKLL